VIPGNDDAIRAVRLYISAAADSVLDGRNTAVGMVSGRESEQAAAGGEQVVS
jgi:small subunit ribosomal protein S2